MSRRRRSTRRRIGGSGARLRAPRCETCSTNSWTNCAVGRTPPPGARPSRTVTRRIPTTTPTIPTTTTATSGRALPSDRDAPARRPGRTRAARGRRRRRATARPRAHADRRAPRAFQRQGRRRSRPGGGGPRRPVGGPEDGAGDGRPRMGPRIGLLVVIAVIAIVLLLGGTIVGFITDAIWFRSVSFENVFWTRVGTQAGLFVGTFVVGLLVLLGGLLARGSRRAPRLGHGRERHRLVLRAPGRGGPRGGGGRPVRPPVHDARLVPGPVQRPRRRTVEPGASSGRPPFGTGAWSSDRRPARPHAARRIGLTILAIIIALGIGGFRGRRLGDDPALDPPGPVRAGRRSGRHRPDLRPGHRVLPVRAAVPAGSSRRSSTACSSAASILAGGRYLVGAR